MKFFSSSSIHYLFIFSAALTFLTESCSSQKETVASRGLQNLTARYNIIYNAEILLEESRLNIENRHFDDYSQILSVYKEPNSISAGAETGNLDSVITKASTIVNEKFQSNYVDDAYFLIAKANYYKANFFNATEFFDYVSKTYPHELQLKQEALTWKAKSLLQLSNLAEAKQAIDTALKQIDANKKSAYNVYAVAASYFIKNGQEPQAIEMLKKATALVKNKQEKARWTYILAQLQERNHQEKEAYENYTSVVNSNAPFEMAFNASLNRIRMENATGGENEQTIERLLALLKNEKNKDFTDQIYYRIGNLYEGRNEISKAIESYNRSLSSSTKNESQKGLTYLQLANLNFNNAYYEASKLYFDSALASLPPSYPEYELIKRKRENLELLADRLQTISHETILQNLARLNEAEREEQLDKIIAEQEQKALTSAKESLKGTGPNEGKFYFDNSAAIAQGLRDFKRRWGNRKLEDNWRRSNKASSEITAMALDTNANKSGMTNASSASAHAGKLRNELRAKIPLTAAQLEQSDKKIINAYYDIASFYRDELKDNKEAIRMFEELLKRYPENPYTPSVYYNLYRLYENINPAQAQEYKLLLTARHPESSFTKVILDPDFARKSDAQANAVNSAYNEIYTLYANKDYQRVIERINETEAKYGQTNLSLQLAYLKALAVGRTSNLAAFETSLNRIISNYTADSIITPLVKQHLDFIGENRETLRNRPVVLMDYHPGEEPFVEEPQLAAAALQNKAIEPPASAPAKKQGDAPVVKDDLSKTVSPQAIESQLFSLPDSAEYYYVINVLEPRVNLSSSRFGIGQFNRSNYPGNTIRHQLKEVNNENQLIFIGPFNSKGAVSEYERRINPLLGNIMKISSDKYNTFVITREILEKLDSSKIINAYIDFIRNKK